MDLRSATDSGSAMDSRSGSVKSSARVWHSATKVVEVEVGAVGPSAPGPDAKTQAYDPNWRTRTVPVRRPGALERPAVYRSP